MTYETWVIAMAVAGVALALYVVLGPMDNNTKVDKLIDLMTRVLLIILASRR